MKLTQLNELQMPTWSWLKVNSAQLDAEADLARTYKGGRLSADDKIKTEHQGYLKIVPNLPQDMERVQEFVLKNKNYEMTVTIPKGVRLEKPVLLEFVLDEAFPVLIDSLCIKAEEGSSADVVVTYRANGSGTYFHSGFAYVEAERNSRVRIIKSQMLGSSDSHLDTTAVSVGEGAQGNVLYCELGGGQVVSGCNISLEGNESKGDLSGIYLGSGEEKQDFNYRVELTGRDTLAKVVVRGALAGKSKKTLKSTLDFVKGASGAKGGEEETVLTLSDRAVNLSVPLLLSGESDIEGSHATSSGRPDAEKLYYLMSRGFTEKDAKRLLVEASFTPVLNSLPSEELRQSAFDRIREVVHDEK